MRLSVYLLKFKVKLLIYTNIFTIIDMLTFMQGVVKENNICIFMYRNFSKHVPRPASCLYIEMSITV